MDEQPSPSTPNPQPRTKLELYHTTKTHLSGLPGSGIFAIVSLCMDTALMPTGDSPGDLALATPCRPSPGHRMSCRHLAFVRVPFPGPFDYPTRHPAKQTAENPNPAPISNTSAFPPRFHLPPQTNIHSMTPYPVAPAPVKNPNPVGRGFCRAVPGSHLQYTAFPPFSVRRHETGCQKVPKGAKRCQKVPESARKCQNRHPGFPGRFHARAKNPEKKYRKVSCLGLAPRISGATSPP